MAATSKALMFRLFGANLAASVKNPSNLDLLQVVNQSGKVVWKLSSTGVATTNPSTSTVRALLDRFEGSSFSAAFANPSKLDILQVVNEGEKVVFHLTSTGLAVTP